MRAVSYKTSNGSIVWWIHWDPPKRAIDCIPHFIFIGNAKRWISIIGLILFFIEIQYHAKDYWIVTKNGEFTHREANEKYADIQEKEIVIP
jgi:hypothetical protein